MACEGLHQGGWFSSDKCYIESNKCQDVLCYYEGSKAVPYCYKYPSDCPRYKALNGSSGGCFITTITCEILKKDDDDEVMQKLRYFRDEVLQKEEDKYEILKMYDTIGPVLASNILYDKDREVLASFLYEQLAKIAKLVDEKDYCKAITNYEVITLALINKYHLKHAYNSVADEDFYYEEGEFNPEEAGHGKKIRKTLDL